MKNSKQIKLKRERKNIKSNIKELNKEYRCIEQASEQQIKRFFTKKKSFRTKFLFSKDRNFVLLKIRHLKLKEKLVSGQNCGQVCDCPEIKVSNIYMSMLEIL